MAVLLLGTMGLVGFAALSWIITLAGLSAVHDTFAEYATEDSSVIADNLSLPWWQVWFQFLLLVSIGVLAAMGALKQSAIVLGNFLAAAFALQTYVAHNTALLVRGWKDHYSKGLFMQTNQPAKFTSRAEALLAGLIMTALSTALLIIWLGSVDTIVDLPDRTGKKQQDIAPPPGVQYLVNATGGSYSHNGSYNGGPHMPPPPVGLNPVYHSPPPLPPGAPSPPGYEQNSSPGAHPLPGVGDNAQQSF